MGVRSVILAGGVTAVVHTLEMGLGASEKQGLFLSLDTMEKERIGGANGRARIPSKQRSKRPNTKVRLVALCAYFALLKITLVSVNQKFHRKHIRYIICSKLKRWVAC